MLPRVMASKNNKMQEIYNQGNSFSFSILRRDNGIAGGGTVVITQTLISDALPHVFE